MVPAATFPAGGTDAVGAGVACCVVPVVPQWKLRDRVRTAGEIVILPISPMMSESGVGLLR